MEALKRRHTWHNPRASEQSSPDLSLEKIRALADKHELIQKRTFTNWVNSCISTSSEDGRNPVLVDDLYVDFMDGHILVTLIRTLSGDNLPKMSKGKMRIHHLENVEKVLGYLRSNGCQLENVHAHDIVDGNPKIILGLVWKLILKYHLTTLKSFKEKEQKTSVTVIKKSLLSWCQMSLQEPDLIDYQTMLAADPRKRLDTVFALARDSLNVPCLLESEDLVGFQEEKSIMIYLAALYQVFTSTKSQTKREKSNVHSLSISSPASLIKCTLLKLLQICEKLLLRDKLITVYEEKVDRLLQWLIRRTDDLNSTIGITTEDAASGATLAKMTNEERPAKLCEWSEAILAYRCIRAHCSANHLAPYVPLASKTLSSLEETWLTLEKMLQKNRRVQSSKACSQHLKSAFEKKLSRKVERLTHIFHDASQMLSSASSLPAMVKVTAKSDQFVANLRQTIQLVEVMQAKGIGNLSQWKQRLLDLNMKATRFRDDVDKKKALIVNNRAPLLLQKASFVSEYLRDAKVSAEKVNAEVNFGGAHSTLQKMRCHQLSVEIAAYQPLVKMHVADLKEIISSSAVYDSKDHTKELIKAVNNLEAAFHSLELLREEMLVVVKEAEALEVKIEAEKVSNVTAHKGVEMIQKQDVFECTLSSSSDEEQALNLTTDSPKTNRVALIEHRLVSDTSNSTLSSNNPSITVIDVNSTRPSSQSPTDDNRGPFSEDSSPIPVLIQVPAELPSDATTDRSPDSRSSVHEANTHTVPVITDSTPDTDVTPTVLSVTDTLREPLIGSIHDTSESVASSSDHFISHEPQQMSSTVTTFSSTSSAYPIEPTENSQAISTCDDDDICKMPRSQAASFRSTESEGLSQLPLYTPEPQKVAVPCTEYPRQHDIMLFVQALVDDIVSRVQDKITSGVRNEMSALQVLRIPPQTAIDELVIPVVLQSEMEWISERRATLKNLKHEQQSLELEKENFGDVSFALLERLQLLKKETSIHFNRVNSLKQHGRLSHHSQRMEVEHVHSELVTFSQSVNKEVSILLQLLDQFEMSIRLDLALQWYSEQEYFVKELDAPGGSLDVAHQIQFVQHMQSEAEELYESLNISKNEGQVASHYLPTQKVSIVVDSHNYLVSLMENRISLLDETLRASSFSEWADVFAIWLVEKRRRLDRFRIPHSVEVAESYLVHFKRCLSTTLTVAKRCVDEWEGPVKGMMETCSTFSKGLHHIFMTLRTDCSEYEERLQKMLTAQELQLSIRYHLFMIDDLVKQVKSCLEQEMEDCTTYTESQLTSRLYHLLVEQQSFERQFTSVCEKTTQLVAGTSSNEVGRKFLTSDQNSLESIWKQYKEVNLKEREKCSQMLQSVKLCSRTTVMISSVESLLRNMSEPYDKESEYSILRAMDTHKTDAGRIFAAAIEVDALLKDASVVWCNLAQYQCHQKTTYEFSHLRELWSEVPVVWEARKQELVESYQVLAGSKSVQNAEWLLAEIDPGSVPDADNELALIHLEDVIVAKGARLQDLVNSVAEESNPESVFGNISLNSVLDPDFTFLLSEASDQNEIVQDDSLSRLVEEDALEGPPKRKGILKKPKLFINMSDDELAERYLSSSPVMENSYYQYAQYVEVIEDEVVCTVLEEEVYIVQWDNIFGPLLFEDSPVISSSLARKQSIPRSGLQFNNPPVIERAHALVLPDENSNFANFVESVLPPETIDVQDKRVKFSPLQSPCYFYPPEFELQADEELLSLDSFDEAHGFQDPHSAMENLFHVVSEQRGKSGSMWSWLNQKKTPPPQAQQINSNPPIQHTLATEFVNPGQLIQPMENTEDQPLDPDGDMLYSVGSLSSIIERYEGRLFRKHVMETWSKKASKRSWKQFHAVVYQGQMAFYKDAKHALMGREVSASALFLRGARCVVASDYKKRPHVFRVTLGTGAEFLFEANNYMEMDEWVQNITSQISQEGSTLSLPTVVGSPPPPYGGKKKKSQKKKWSWNV